MNENELAAIVVDLSLMIHKKLGPGLLESVYESILYAELIKRGLHVERQVPIPVVWDELVIEDSFRADLIVERSLLLELKSVEASKPVFKKQVLTYLKLTDLKLGLLLNFGSALMKDGIERIINGNI